MSDIAVHMIVHGYVQGVGFRYYVYKHAAKLGLRGMTKNLSNGCVEVLAEGNRSVLEELIRLVKVGPRSAQVNDVEIEWREASNTMHGFEIL